MQLNEYTGPGDRKATVILIESHWDARFNKWEVTFYIRNRMIEKRTVTDFEQAETIAETFVSGFDASKVLLNE